MTELLEIRDRIRSLYASYEVFIVPVIKFILGLIVFNMLNSRLGYMQRIDNMAVVLILALACSFLPFAGMITLAALISLLHMYALSLEVAIVGLCVYLIMFLLYLRFAPKDAIVVILTPVTCAMGIPYVMPIAAGLLGTPASAVSIGCGVIAYFLLHGVAVNASTFDSMGDAEATAKVRLIVDSLISNRQMMVMIIAFAITVILVYLVRRMSIDYSWTIAIIAGAITDIIVMLIGDLLYDTNISFVAVILGSLLGAVIGKLIEFFRFSVDYSRVEKVQFEDDEYYYYVKAVPKMSLMAGEKTVKRINTQFGSRRGSSRGRRKDEYYEDDYYEDDYGYEDGEY